MKTVITKNAPAPIGPYSQAVIVNGLLYTSGQVALTPAGDMKQGIAEEVVQVFANLKAVLNEAGLDFCDVFNVKIYLTDLADFALVNTAMQEHFDQPYPSRSTIQVVALPKSAKVEIEIIATIK